MVHAAPDYTPSNYHDPSIVVASQPVNGDDSIAVQALDYFDNVKLPALSLLELDDVDSSSKIDPARQKDNNAKDKIQWHFLQQPSTIYRPDLFERFSKPLIFSGRQDLTSFLYLGGLTASGYAWFDYANKIFKDTGIHSEVYALAGHDGTWQSLRDINEQDWINDLKEKVKNLKAPPIVFCYSTSLLVAMEVERQQPGTFKAIVGIGGPFFLANKKLEDHLDRGLEIDRAFRTLTFQKFSPLTYGSVSMNSGSLHAGPKRLRRNPYYTRLPMPTALSLRRLQLQAREALKEVNVPVFYAQGELDPIVAEHVPKFIVDSLGSSKKPILICPDSGHGPQMGSHRYQLLHQITTFLQNL